MARKKVPTNANGASATYLEDDEQLVEEVTTTKKIGRQRRKPDVEETIAAEPVFEIENDDEEENAEEAPAFGADSIAAVLFETEGQPYDNQFCTIKIRRNPDSIGDNFLNPCASQTNLLPMRNVELTADRMDIEDRVRKEYGGGHYDFQIYYNGALRSGWKATLGDDPTAAAAAKAAKQPPQTVPTPEIPSPAADPLDSMLNNLAKIRSLKDALFGDEQARFEREIAELKAEIANSPKEPDEPKTEAQMFYEMAKNEKNEDLRNRLLDRLLPSEEAGSRHWLADTLNVVFENKDTLLPLVGAFLGGGMMMPPAVPSRSVADIGRGQPPPSPPKKAFHRPTREPEPPPETISEAEIISETKTKKAKAKDAETGT